jgi:hypothetical protein
MYVMIDLNQITKEIVNIMIKHYYISRAITQPYFLILNWKSL